MQLDQIVLGMDIGGTNLRMGWVDREYTAHDVEVIPSAGVYQSENTAVAIAKVVKAYCVKHFGEGMPAIVAAGFPSVVDRDRRKIYSSTNFPGLDGVDIVKAMSDYLHIPVIIEHDAYYLLSYDIYSHGMKNEGTLIGCYFGTGLGNAMYIDGKAYYGKNGTACEIGHMPIPLSEEPCSCGNKGCIEMFSCGKAFERLTKKHFPETPIGEVFETHAQAKVLDEFVRYMAAPVATCANIMDPDGIFLGGGLVQMAGFPKEKLVDYILQNTRKPYPAANLCLYFSKRSPENGIIGAAIEGFRKL